MFRKAAPEPKEFWDWFVANEPRIHAVATGRESVIQEIGKHLAPFDVVFEMSIGDHAEREFIVSTDGIKERIPKVQDLVNAAPSIPGWKVIAFRPPKGGGLIQFQGRSLEEMDIWFSAKRAGEKTDLVLYLANPNDRANMGMTFLILDSLLGEYGVMTRVGAIDWRPLPPDPVRDGLRPIKDLPEAIT